MTVNSAGGVRFYIGTTAPATTEAEFEADSYIEVEEVEDAGQVGDESSVITFTALKDGRTRKLRGPKDAGVMPIIVGDDPSDPGQVALLAAADRSDQLNNNFMVTLNDQLTLSGTPTVLYFRGIVTSERRNIGNVSNVVRRTFNINVNTAIVEVPAT